jgi:hypothetical protein
MNAQAAALLESNGLKPTLGRATLSGIADEMSTYSTASQPYHIRQTCALCITAKSAAARRQCGGGLDGFDNCQLAMRFP